MLDSTVGGAAATSYLSLSAATAYFTGRLEATAWTTASIADQEAALVMATTRLECETYQGYRFAYTQALQWPRSSTFDRDGHLLSSATIPTMIQQATCELALAILKEPTLLGDTGLEGFVNIKVGSLDVTPRGFQPAGVLPAFVKRLIAPVRQGGLGSTVQRA